ncbi:hypothetical protein F4779DRAFT_214458 [Xylariaceae sp. FL0662B]|nr:hypothetical protein F4779DRAFT_214458 [Xylariaceae sp. FL0662B]
MSKISIEMSITWLSQTFQSASFHGLVWNIISWVAFAFKLASLAFALPIVALIGFDFCLWIWRLNRPPPHDDLQAHTISHASTAKKTSRTKSRNGTSSATLFATDPTLTQRRTAYSGHTTE